MKNTELYLQKILADKTVNNIAIKVGKKDEVIYETYRSNLIDINENTLFDMASVSKILSPTVIALIALDKGLISLDTKLSEYFEIAKDKENLTLYNLLTHTMGFGHKGLNLPEVNYENVAEHILSIPCDFAVGSRYEYSCPGFILLGKLLEKVFGKKLDELFKELVAKPLGMENSGYLPKDISNLVQSNYWEKWQGLPNDYNCRHLGGIAGNAGIFSNMKDLTAYAKMLIAKGAPLMKEETFNSAAKNYTADMELSRGLGFVYCDEKFSQTAALFKSGSIGHCGHTGQSLFVDTKTGFYVIVLSDATYLNELRRGGREDYNEIMKFREELHGFIKMDLEG